MQIDRYELIRAGVFKARCRFECAGGLIGEWDGASELSFPSLGLRIRVKSVPQANGGHNRYLICGGCGKARTVLSFSGERLLCLPCTGKKQDYSTLGRIEAQQARIEQRLHREYAGRKHLVSVPTQAGARRQALVDRWWELQDLRAVVLVAIPIARIAKQDGLALPQPCIDALNAVNH